MSDDMTIDEFAALSAGHALHALSAEDAARFRAARDAHPEWEQIVIDDEQTAAGLSEGAVLVEPPADVRGRVLDAIAAPAASPAAPSTEVVQTIQRRAWTRGLVALAASFALLVGVGWGVGAISNSWRTPAAVTALHEIRDTPDAESAQAQFDGGAATAHWSVSLGKTVLVAKGLPAVPEGHTFELWYVRDGTPIAAGTFSADAGAATAQLTGQMQPGDTIAVTVEVAGGSPDGTPTTSAVLSVPTA